MSTVPGGGAKVIDALASISDQQAREHLRRYFGLQDWANREYEGAHFERIGRQVPDELITDDIVALSCLSIHIPAKAALGILGDRAVEISSLLADIPTDLALEDLPLEEHEKHFGHESAASRLWRLLRGRDHSRWGVGPTSASKLMARKRPALVPIYDSVVAGQTGFSNSDGTWRAWHEAFSQDGTFVARLRQLRSAEGLDKVSLLRILDVVLWMQGSRGVRDTETVDANGDR